MNRLLLAAAAVLSMGAAVAPTPPPKAIDNASSSRGVATPEAVRAIQARLDQIDRDAAESRQEQREIEDLRAQQAMVGIGRWQLWLSLATTVVAAASIGFTVAALRQTRESLNLQRRSAMAQLRPYIALETFQGTDIDPAGRTCFLYMLINRGVTPAVNVRWVGSAEFLPSTPTDYAVKVPPFESAMDAPSMGQSEPLQFFLRLKTFTPDEIAAVLDGKACVVIHLQVKYDDSFGETFHFHYTERRWGASFVHSNVNILV